jgi:hypothetical protein
MKQPNIRAQIDCNHKDDMQIAEGAVAAAAFLSQSGYGQISEK